MEDSLKLKAEDLEDLKVISACLQDALTRVADMAYLKPAQRFAVVFSRYMWETKDLAPGAAGMRVRVGLHFNGVRQIDTQGIDQADRNGLLPLLALVGEATDEGATITFSFAGGGNVRLTADRIDAHLTDMGTPWPTPSRPDHALDGELPLDTAKGDGAVR